MASNSPMVLVVAGHDPSGGAGILIDSMVLHSIGVSTSAAITTVTVQNSEGLSASEPVAPELLDRQIRTVIADSRPNVIKIGALCDQGQIDVVRNVIKDEGTRAIIDPILRPSKGSSLASVSEEELAAALWELILECEGATPNTNEALKLLRAKGDASEEEVGGGVALAPLKMGQRLLEAAGDSAGWVIVTGGHISSDQATDTLVTRSDHSELSAPMSDFGVRGTGCLFSSCIAGRLAIGDDIHQAFRFCKSMTSKAIQRAEQIGHGSRQITPRVLYEAF